MSAMRPVRAVSTASSPATTSGLGATMICDTAPGGAPVRGKSRAIAANGTNTLSLSGPL